MSSARFAARAAMWSLLLFGLLRLPWVDAHLVAPLTAAEAGAAMALSGPPTGPFAVGSSCSGTDTAALLLAAILAYPTAPVRRLAGAAGGAAFLLALNVARIASLGRVAHDPRRLHLLHRWVWPAVLIAALFGYALLWMRRQPAREAMPPGKPLAACPRRALATGAVAVFLFVLAGPLYLDSAALGTASVWAASSAAAFLDVLGMQASASGTVVTTARGAFQITPECLATPLLPLYVVAVFSLPLALPRRALALAAAAPLFFVLGVLRLLILAVPAALITSPEHAIHGFFQVLVGVIAVPLVAHLCRRQGEGNGTVARRTALALLAGAATAAAAGPLATRLVLGAATGEGGAPQGVADPQGAWLLLPPFALALFVAVAIADGSLSRARIALGAICLLLAEVVFVTAAAGIGRDLGVQLAAREVRGFAVALPLLLVWRLDRRSALRPDSAPRGFWDDLGARFPDLGGAASTAYYLDCERRLFTEHVPDLASKRLLKTDLWDEAKNTRILAWASERGARAYGIDISGPIALQARAAFPEARPLQAAVADVRRIPFRDASFDLVYSMGTIEHFAETEAAVAEIRRVLRPGGLAIVGVPNRLDPFLRPLLVWVLRQLGLYAYGPEKSYTRAGLRRMLERQDLEVVTETAILFVPGWLRMLDLACHAWCRPLARLTAPTVRLFARLERAFPGLRRHGYLLATVARRRA